MNRIYFDKNIGKINGYNYVCADETLTGLQYDILMFSSKSIRWFRGKPRIYVITNCVAVPVSISNEPTILSKTKIDHFDPVSKWIKQYSGSLYEHWIGNLTDKEVLNILEN